MPSETERGLEAVLAERRNALYSMLTLCPYSDVERDRMLADFDALLNLALAATRRRQAWDALQAEESRTYNTRTIAAADRDWLAAQSAEDRELDALEAHLCGGEGV
jgi:hypothetical protein